MEAQREILLLEAILAASNIATGLTSIRRYTFANKGAFFTGMFAFTIGLERLLKLSVVLDHWHANGSPPENADLRRFGHEIGGLLDRAREINVRRRFGVDTASVDDALVVQVVTLISEFAKRTRYYNLDSISGSIASDQREPLAAWDDLVGSEIIKRHYQWTKRRRQALFLGMAMKNRRGIVVGHTADDGSKITETETLTQHAVLAETKQKYAVYYLHRLVEFAIDVLEPLDHKCSPPLYISEPFRTMSCVPRAMVLRRKSWKPYL